jgi:four helix bundle protein
MEIVMNANPAFAASVVPALAASDLRAPARKTVTSIETFDVYRISLEAGRECLPVAASAGAILRDQLLRASSSVVLNVAEGFGSSSRGVKRRHYEIARGSATQCITVLDLASALGDGDGIGVGVGEARVLFTRVAMMLAKLEARFR